jgi:hypothetical protein
LILPCQWWKPQASTNPPVDAQTFAPVLSGLTPIPNPASTTIDVTVSSVILPPAGFLFLT